MIPCSDRKPEIKHFKNESDPFNLCWRKAITVYSTEKVKKKYKKRWKQLHTFTCLFGKYILFCFSLVILYSFRFLEHKENTQSHIKHSSTREGIYWSQKPDITKTKTHRYLHKDGTNCHDILTCKKMHSSLTVSIK